MSRKPNIPQITELMEQLKIMADCQERLLVIEKLVEEQRQLERKAEPARRKVLDLIEQMDLKSSGNFGYEGRTLCFLTELYRQIYANGLS